MNNQPMFFSVKSGTHTTSDYGKKSSVINKCKILSKITIGFKWNKIKL